MVTMKLELDRSFALGVFLMFFKVNELSLDLNGHLQITELRIELSGEKTLLSKILWFIETDLGSHNIVTYLSIDD